MSPSKQRSGGPTVDELRRSLLDWFDAHRRQLPWRGVDDPYAVWVSEIMLQQTQVATVIDYFERWMSRFPNVQALAAADLEDVLAMWSGLGYYRRARYLHRGARMVVEEFGADVPSTVGQLKKIPGVGPYTAGAIASIAFGRAEPLVDGNVERVISRLEAIGGDPKKAAAANRIWARAAELVDPKRPGDFNQALMELGSLVCTVRGPACQQCPVADGCAAFAAGNPEAFPETAKRKKPQTMRARAAVIGTEQEGQKFFLLRRRPPTGLLAGLWEFPSYERAGKTWPRLADLRGRVNEAPGLKLEAGVFGRTLGTVEHIFSHRRLHLRVHEATLTKPIEVNGDPGSDWQWCRRQDLADLASAALLGKVLKVWEGQ